MHAVILAPYKLATRIKWHDLGISPSDRLVLFTGAVDAPNASVLRSMCPPEIEICSYRDYDRNDLVEVDLYKYCAGNFPERIIALAEVDIIRSARVREKLGIPGLKLSEAMLYRDKNLMKRKVREHGIATTDFAVVDNPLAALEQAQKWNYQLVIKPVCGRGSNETFIVNSPEDFRHVLAGGVWNDRGSVQPVLLERFVHAPQFRVDGLIEHGRCVFMSPAQYIGTHLDYIKGKAFGSVILGPEHPYYGPLTDLTQKVLELTLPRVDHGGFHLEAFVPETGQPIFSEVAIRLGGGSIVEEVESAYGLNLRTEILRRELGHSLGALSQKQRWAAGQLHIPPREGILKGAPRECSLPGVSFYEFLGQMGFAYDLMTHTNAEIARFLLEAPSEADVRQLITTATAWIDDQLIWEVSDHGR
jgi:hypothetical protein